jgi:hypothetical protein
MFGGDPGLSSVQCGGAWCLVEEEQIRLMTNSHLVEEEHIRLMTNSHKSQSEKLATGGGRETTAEKPDNN